jgi:hypothetical protein
MAGDGQNHRRVNVLHVADRKAAALSTRATLDQEGGRYLFPLPMTGETPQKLRRLVMDPARKSIPTLLFQTEAGDTHRWQEQWFVVQSHTYAHTQNKACLSRIGARASQAQEG